MELKLQSTPTYDVRLTRKYDDDSLRAEKFMAHITESAETAITRLQTCSTAASLFTDEKIALDPKAAVFALVCENMQGLPHEYFGALRMHFEQVQ